MVAQFLNGIKFEHKGFIAVIHTINEKQADQWFAYAIILEKMKAVHASAPTANEAVEKVKQLIVQYINKN